ncbi:MAG: site-specific recombinase, phage integrase family [uncultured Sulfurovum sp.]|uniref:Site-specific recombinase, phage integrase family n=1 Tax=uncultured Sulfurovum sp. TaxID=269237 RepID=A0A6S6S8Q4_9BACT|nr:MAG: site-specific recombinase, phage integrase family [uncultured Sulfurovum sp.]
MKTKQFKSKKFTGVYYRLLQDKSRTYFITYKDPTTNDPKKLTIGNTKEGFNEAYAHQKRSEILSTLRFGDDPNIPILKSKQTQITLDDLANNYFKDLLSQRDNKSTKSAEAKYFGHISKTLGTVPSSQLSKDHAKKLQTSLINKKYANQTINGIIELLSRVINYNLKNDIIKGSNPLYGFKKLKVDGERERYLTKEEISTLLSNTKEDKTLHLFTLLALSTGARLNGVLTIQKKDIDLKKGTIKIKDHKSNDTYNGFIKNDTRELLEETIKDLNNNDYVISYDHGKLTDDKRIQRRLKPIFDNLFNKELSQKDTINRVVIHTLRHTFASLLAINDVSIYKIMKLMNHKDINMTMRYAKLAPNSGQDDINKLF